MNAGAPESEDRPQQSRSIAWVFAFALGVSFLDRVQDKLGVSDILSKLLHEWRDITHQFWSQLFAFFIWAIPVAPNRTQMDVLTVTALMYSACISVVVRRWLIEHLSANSTRSKRSDDDRYAPALFGLSLAVIAFFFALDVSNTEAEEVSRTVMAVCGLAVAFCYTMERALAADWLERVFWFVCGLIPCAFISLPFPEPHTHRVGDSEIFAVLASPANSTLILVIAIAICIGTYLIRVIAPYVLLRGIAVAVGILLADWAWRAGLVACRMLDMCEAQ